MEEEKTVDEMQATSAKVRTDVSMMSDCKDLRNVKAKLAERKARKDLPVSCSVARLGTGGHSDLTLDSGR
jgi:hypothetical protein